MLLNLIDDMMDLAKTEKMKFDLNNQYFDLTEIIKKSFEHMEYLSIEKKIDLSLNVED
jgi:signal transduction histidine kinase